MAKFILSIKWLFVLVMIILVAGISISNYLFSFHLYEKYLYHHLDTVNSLFKAEVEKLTNPVESFLYNIQALVCCKLLDFKEVEKTNQFLMNFMKKYPYVTSINYGDGKGNGYLLLNDEGRWLNRIKKAEDKGYVIWNTLNNDGKIIKKERLKDDYDPTNTVWYKQALEGHDIQWSKQYIFRTTKDPGITASLLLCNKSKEVVGIDMMIKDISLSLSKIKQNLHPEGKLYLILDDQDLVGFVDEISPEPGRVYKLNEKDFPLAYKALTLRNDKSFFKMDFQDKRWFVSIATWKIKNRKLSLITIIPKTAITKDLNFHLLYQMFVSLFLTGVVFLYIVKKYIHPILDISNKAVNLGFKEIYLEKYAQRTDEIGYLSRVISDASIKILEAKKIEKRLQESQYFDSVRRSLGEAVHRFKDLINAIQGFATLAQQKVSDDFVKNALEQIISASKRAIYITKQILTLTEERQYEMRETDLNSIILSMKTKIASMAGENIKVVYELSPYPPKINLDISAFDEVMVNLISNARDAMPNGGTLTIKTNIASFFNKKFGLLSISDTGIGVDEETRQKIFEPFFTTKGAKGTGLGLSIVYRIIKDHGGFIEVESDFGKGTTFKIYFPLIEDWTSFKASSGE